MNKLSGRVLMHKTNDFVENCTFKLTKIVNVIKIKLTIDEIKQKIDGIKAIINGDGV